jgi:hypothetical protein
MTDFYTELPVVADELLAEFGAACSLGKMTKGAYNPATGTTSISYPPNGVTAAVFDFPQKYIDGTLIKVGDKRVLLSAVGLTVTPEPGDHFTDVRDTVLTVIAAKDIAPAGTSVLWVLQVRK